MVCSGRGWGVGEGVPSTSIHNHPVTVSYKNILLTNLAVINEGGI